MNNWTTKPNLFFVLITPLFTGFMYNTFFRTEIEDQDHRKYIDTYMGPNAIASSMMGVVRNYVYTLACRVSMDLLIPITRMGTIKFFQTFTFTDLKKATFAEGFLHTRFFRQFFETGIDLFEFATFWVMTNYKNKYIDPPIPATTLAPPTTTSAFTADPHHNNLYNRIDHNYNNYNNQNDATTESYLENSDHYNDSYKQPYNPYDDVNDRYDTFYHQYVQPYNSQQNQQQNNPWKGIRTLKDYIEKSDLPRSLSSYASILQPLKTKAM